MHFGLLRRSPLLVRAGLALLLSSALLMARANDGAPGATPNEVAPSVSSDMQEPGTDVGANRAIPVVQDGPASPTERPTTPPSSAEAMDRVTVDGMYVLLRDADTDVVIGRFVLPAPAEIVGLNDDGTYELSLDFLDGSTTRTAFDPASPPSASTPFAAPVDGYGVLQAATNGVAMRDLAAAAERDPTNPWLALRLARSSVGAARSEQIAALVALAPMTPFFESFHLAAELFELGEIEAATLLLDAATEDLAARGYDPSAVTDPAHRAAFGLPANLLASAMDRGDRTAAMQLAPYALRTATPAAPSELAALRAATDLLEGEAAADLLNGVRQLERGSLASVPDRVLLALANLGWWLVVALLAATLLLWWVLTAKAWPARTLLARQRVERGGRRRRLGRFWVPRYASTTEKVVLLALLLLLPVATTLASWNERRTPVPIALQTGSFASDPALEAALALPEGPRRSWIVGLSQAQRGEDAAALETWTDAGAFAPALVNRAILTSDPADDALVQAALAADPNQPLARALAGRGDTPSPWYASTPLAAPQFALPTPLDLDLAVAGDWRAALQRLFDEPGSLLTQGRPAPLPAWTWWTAVALYLLLASALFVNLLVPRPRITRNAPRNLAYHAGALLVPGSGHADELWGILLLVPWSVLATDLLVGLVPGNDNSPLGLAPTLSLALLGVFWFVNLIGFTIELISYRNRMWSLRHEHPELARAYGLRVAHQEPAA